MGSHVNGAGGQSPPSRAAQKIPPSLKIVLVGLERCDLTPKITFQVCWSFADLAKSVPAACFLF